MNGAVAILLAFGAYAGLGALFAAWFVTAGAARLDPAARGLPLQARLILWPGAVALWPLLAWKQAKSLGPPLQ